MKTNILLTTGFLALFSFQSNATTIDFDSVDTYVPGASYLVETINDATFSHHITSQWDDGFYQAGSQVGNYYGTRNEYITWDNSIYLESIDFKNWAGLFGESLILSMYDELGALIDSLDYAVTSNWQTAVINTDNVFKMVIDFTGGYDEYGDGRRAAWYFIDTIQYSDSNVTSAVPEPGILVLMGLGIFGLGLSRRKMKK